MEVRMNDDEENNGGPKFGGENSPFICSCIAIGHAHYVIYTNKSWNQNM
jgi:hypothetical protein